MDTVARKRTNAQFGFFSNASTNTVFDDGFARTYSPHPPTKLNYDPTELMRVAWMICIMLRQVVKQEVDANKIVSS